MKSKNHRKKSHGKYSRGFGKHATASYHTLPSNFDVIHHSQSTIPKSTLQTDIPKFSQYSLQQSQHTINDPNQWDDYITTQQNDLFHKEQSLKNLEKQLSKMKVSTHHSANQSSELTEWESYQVQNIDREKRRLRLRSERLIEQQNLIDKDKNNLETLYQSKLQNILKHENMIQSYQKQLFEKHASLKQTELVLQTDIKQLRLKESNLKNDKKQLEINRKNFELQKKKLVNLENELKTKTSKMDQLINEYKSKIMQIDAKHAELAEMEKLLQKEQEGLEKNWEVTNRHKMKQIENQIETVRIRERALEKNEAVFNEKQNMLEARILEFEKGLFVFCCAMFIL